MPSAISAAPTNATAGHAEMTAPSDTERGAVADVGADRGSDAEPEHARAPARGTRACRRAAMQQHQLGRRMSPSTGSGSSRAAVPDWPCARPRS